MFKNKPYKTPIFILSSLLFIFLFLSLFLFSPGVFADTPPRPELTPTPHPTTIPVPTVAPSQSSQSAAIILTLSDPDLAYWTSVQWLDEEDEWQDASGWQSDFNENGMVVWAVAAKDYGTGPYRWVIYTEEDGTVHSTTDLFYLPESKRNVWISGDD